MGMRRYEVQHGPGPYPQPYPQGDEIWLAQRKAPFEDLVRSREWRHTARRPSFEILMTEAVACQAFNERPPNRAGGSSIDAEEQDPTVRDELPPDDVEGGHQGVRHPERLTPGIQTLVVLPPGLTLITPDAPAVLEAISSAGRETTWHAATPAATPSTTPTRTAPAPNTAISTTPFWPSASRSY